jgi:hypothetical protein
MHQAIGAPYQSTEGLTDRLVTQAHPEQRHALLRRREDQQISRRSGFFAIT